ncbi:EVE domain-containing protein [uncultured Alsobacter sp.]|uniref:EVE domain-containing protein n=1 Tax=uncultured Alsobacter sp. TaxID=1748258 RepID=UPI0025CE781D|nr:EVE domain-containing protein [uncultured Alsobacter sp.]
MPTTNDASYWLGVACAAHVRRGRGEGFMQLCHGRAAPLRRIRPGDGIVYYSPTTQMGVPDGYRSLTAIGRVRERDTYRVTMAPGFEPFRRDVEWAASREIAIAPLLPLLSFSAGNRNWGYQLRRGIVPMTAEDFELIAGAMAAAAVEPAAA